jgi:hypothetical protein
MLLDALQRSGTQADRIMLFPDYWKVPKGTGAEYGLEGSRFPARVRDEYGAKLVPIKLQSLPNNEPKGWEHSYNKLLAFNQSQYKRVISLDSHATLRHVRGYSTNRIVSAY